MYTSAPIRQLQVCQIHTEGFKMGKHRHLYVIANVIWDPTITLVCLLSGDIV